MLAVAVAPLAGRLLAMGAGNEGADEAAPLATLFVADDVALCFCPTSIVGRLICAEAFVALTAAIKVRADIFDTRLTDIFCSGIERRTVESGAIRAELLAEFK